ncbi:MAG: hypothetical protein CL920_30940 [Deltaproteobacteria bacterium]|nr:hypothetical protein [Deltaproteobacteria bacterium]
MRGSLRRRRQLEGEAKPIGCAWGPPPVPGSKASEARQLHGQAKRGSCMGKRSAAAAWASEARQLHGQAKRGSCRGEWQLARSQVGEWQLARSIARSQVVRAS